MSQDRAGTAPRIGGVLYHRPEIYDVAFGWDLTKELAFLESVFARHAGGSVRRVLEPCCGTGRLLAALAGRGYAVSGYDLSEEMVAFARARLASRGGEIHRGEMSAFDPPGPFDAAINLVNSIGYLLDDASVAAHLSRTAAALRPGGIYVVQLSYGDEPPELARFGPWGNRRGDLSTTLLWEVAREDAAAKRSYQRCLITARRGTERWRIEEDHVLRYWTQEDVDRLVGESPFSLEAIYWDRFEKFPLSRHRTGENGNLYHVLKRPA
ncbi:MAG TPA: class I SAM-dependent methyltransferase [Candidatus Eisenbacteria bacterium]